MAVSPSASHPLLRCLRVALVTLPVLALGFGLGLGRVERALRAPPPPVRVRPPARPRLQVVDAAGRTRTAVSGPLTLRLDRGERLRLSGGKLARVDLRASSLQPREALHRYGEEFRRDGWKSAPEFSSLVDTPAAGILLRLFRKGGKVRLLLVSPQQNPAARNHGSGGPHEEAGSVATVFEGSFSDRPAPGDEQGRR